MSIPTKGQVDTSDPIVSAFKNGDLLVYPTEAVMGIGCDLSLIHIPSPRDATLSRMPSSA